MNGFIFATGIENSCPTIAGGERVDQMECCGHYRLWREDLRLTAELGLDALRIGPAYYRMHESPGRYRWELFDEVAREMQRLGIEPLVDLLHFGVPDWMESFQNEQVPVLFAEYARAFAERYPHIRYYTPINEMLICARFSAKYGWWNEQKTDDVSYATAMRNLALANVLAMRAIREVRPDAVFIHTESVEHWHAAHPCRRDDAALENELRFVPLDLVFGAEPGKRALAWLRKNGVTADDLRLLQELAVTKGCILGLDYYITSEHLLLEDGSDVPASDALGLAELARQYYSRYGLPLMHTETNMRHDRAVDWLRKQWSAVLHLLETGVPVVGFTWFSLTDQMDWDVALREKRGRVCTVGLADLDRRLRPVGECYRDLVQAWRDRLPCPRITAEPDAMAVV